MLKACRVLSVLCLLVFLGLPLAAQTQRETVSPFAGFLDAFWARVAAITAPLAPITAIWQADEGGAEDPDPDPLPGGGGSWDPYG